MLARVAMIALLCSCQAKGKGEGTTAAQPGARATDQPRQTARPADPAITPSDGSSAHPDQSANQPGGDTAQAPAQPAAPPPAPAGLPVGYAIKADVPMGQTPMMRIEATQNVTQLQIAFEREDGARFRHSRGKLARGQSFTVPIGDGSPGRAGYQVTLSGKAARDSWNHQFAIETLVRAPLKVSYDFEHLDLDRRVLQFKLSRPAGRAELVVIGDDGSKIGTGSARYQGQSPDTWLSIGWTQKPNTRVMKLQLRAVSQGGLETRVELIPWSVAIEHEDVNFATDSAVIEPSEHAKLDASLAKIRQVIERSERFMKVKLYIAGHTDTVGPAAKNRALSLRRAQAIARYMRKQGLRIPIAVAGFGEQVLAVQTADNTDNRANRRADYVLGPADGAPPFKGPYRKVSARWKQVP